MSQNNKYLVAKSYLRGVNFLEDNWQRLHPKREINKYFAANDAYDHFHGQYELAFEEIDFGFCELRRRKQFYKAIGTRFSWSRLSDSQMVCNRAAWMIEDKVQRFIWNHKKNKAEFTAN
jgi:hypothetical protein